MNTLQIPDDALKAVNVVYKKRTQSITIELDNGRIVIAPLDFLPIIKNNVSEQDLNNSHLIAGGTAVCFGNDEAVSIVTLMGLDAGYTPCKAWRERGSNINGYALHSNP